MQSATNLPVLWNLSLRGSSSRVQILNLKPRKAHTLHCLRSEGHEEFENSQENLGLSSVTKHKDIWNLFKEAQQNILFLNKQRLAAVEELEKLKKQKSELVERINQLEAESQTVTKKDKSSLLWELLLRIDSMVINGLIGIEEASSMRNLVREHEVNISEFPLDVMKQEDAEVLAEIRRFPTKGKRNGLHVIHICTEMAPLVSVGPLASYITGLSCALQGKGYLVEVILPKYSTLDLDEIEGLREIEADAYSYFNGQLHGNRIWNGVVSGIGVTLIQPLYNVSMFSRDKVYGYPDDIDRFSYFSRASLDYIAKSGKKPDVLHIHNWQTAIVGPLFWDVFVNQGLEGTRILLTCQEFDSKCLVPPEKLELCGLDPASLHRADRLQDNTNPQVVNILKGGIVYSNKVVIMSSSCSEGSTLYHRSIPGLEPTLAVHKEKLFFAPFGLDNLTWDPSRDVYLPENYSSKDIRGKSICKVELQRRLGLVEDASVTIVGCIFSDISDVDLESLKSLVLSTAMIDVQFVIMLTNEDQKIIRELEKTQDEIKGGNLKVVTENNEVVSHLIFAGSDIMLCLNFHDPVLQVHLKALRYGTAPIELNPQTEASGHFGTHEQEATAQKFINSLFGSMSLSQALDLIKKNERLWKLKIMEAMEKDLCCDVHVSAYTSLKNL
ncbi:probable starch synthase 4, chloroplastic/amyloplastic isoform X2 [Eutrema salsugineum]|uniref:probable starch synthase 4, chloroplastic/amyloplastic isoform X2 n=1 Tax=Eutrema salsugineum TaxID=72664 RepID=UPI000CED2C89|nr:probable starch synthase 4, chloroplastic/amyloplastic isoform X2 [Eutrema salsugineum]